MKKVKVISLFALVLLLVTTGVSCKKDKVALQTSKIESTMLTQPQENSKKVENEKEENSSSAKTLTVPENEKYSKFGIIKTSTSVREDKGQTLFVLIPAINLNILEERNYVIRVKNLIKQLVVIDKRPENISILVFDDLATLEKVFIKIEPTDLDIASHYIARYDASPSEMMYRNTLVIFPFAPKSNSVINAQTDIIQFNPYEW